MNSENPVWKSVKGTFQIHPRTGALVAVLVVLSVMTSLLPPLVLERAVDGLTEGRGISWQLGLLYIGLIALADCCETAQNGAITLFGQKVTHGLRSTLCAKLDRLPAQYFTGHPSGQTTSVFVNDGDTIDALYSDGIVGMLADACKLLGILGILWSRSRGLFGLLCLLLPLLFVLTRHFQKGTLAAQRENRRAVGRVNSHVPETIRNIRTIHTLGKERYMEERYDSLITDSFRAINRANVFDGIYSPIILVTQAAVVGVIMTGASLGPSWADLFGLSVGSAVAVIAYVGKIFGPLESIGMEIQSIQSAMAGIQHIGEFLGETEQEPVSLEPVPDALQDKAVAFSHVTFGYDPSRPILQDFSCSLAPGEQAILMGPSGCGKSTLFKLLLGMYTPWQGTVSLLGRRAGTILDLEKRSLYGCVEQEFSAVPGTVGDQVTLGDPSVTPEQVDRALDLVQLKETVDRLPLGKETPMREGLFSQGELQLLNIARAVAKEPQLLLLDEITANLDSHTEELVLEALERASQGRTVLSISHRFSRMTEGQRIVRMG
ncbi:ABC transporter ATP-binding protein [Acidaminococcus fermentans]|uniref:ABC transporter ATP-binding protein n=1 Tax=Acidaminococcus fermentans TaxID=905 RepID=UPI00242D1E74|nr:ABC transporter ATP-binding protein [Acidaminococcus fermentans]